MTDARRDAIRPCLDAERALWAQGADYIAGIDEVGRGAWAGPVVACAVVLPISAAIEAALADVRDSKMLTPRDRERLAAVVGEHALAVALGAAPPDMVDGKGLLPATARAMNEALQHLPGAPDHILVDGLPMRGLPQHTAIVKGDARCLSIAAASVVAKVARDCLMAELDAVYPGYHFASHKGYGAPIHREALCRLGPSPIHRLSYAPVAAIAAQQL